MAVIIAEIVLSLFAVFGLYAAVRLLVLCASREGGRLTVSLEIGSCLPTETLRMLLFAARERAALFPGRRVTALVDERLAGHAQIVLFLESEGVPYYYVKMQKEGE